MADFNMNEIINACENELTAAAVSVSAASADKAADKFVEILRTKIEESTFLGRYAKNTLSDIRTNVLSDGAEVWFGGDMKRPSLTGKGEIINIAVLLNNGYEKTKCYVYGTWHGRHTRSLRSRPAASFVNAAIRDFMNLYADEYGVESITEENAGGYSFLS